MVFKSGGVEGLRLNPSKEMEIPGQINMLLHRPLNPGEKRFLTIDYNGKVESMNNSGLLSAIYSVPCLDYTVNGTSTYTPIWASAPGVLWTGSSCAPAKVGIGIQTPTANLDVRGTVYFTGSTVIGTGANISQSNSMLLVKQNTPNRNALTIDFTSSSATTTGIGINTLIDNSKRIAFSITNPTINGDVFRVFGNGSQTIAMQDATTKSFSISNTNNEDVFRILGNGNVWATRLEVAVPNDFPDYVFSSDYKLMPLLDLDKYIQNENHLPNMPTASEVKEEGMDVAEINTLLVEKVEELTLYTIEQQKFINSLMLEIKALKNQMLNK